MNYRNSVHSSPRLVLKIKPESFEYQVTGMKIRTQLIAGFAVFALLLAIISGLVITTNQQAENLISQEEIANTIALDVGELGYLSNDYILYREPQQVDRWNAKYASVSGNIASLSVDQPEQRAIVGNLDANLPEQQISL